MRRDEQAACTHAAPVGIRTAAQVTSKVSGLLGECFEMAIRKTFGATVSLSAFAVSLAALSAPAYAQETEAETAPDADEGDVIIVSPAAPIRCHRCLCWPR